MRETYEIFFKDGNRRLFEAENYEVLLLFLIENKLYEKVVDIKKRKQYYSYRKRGNENEI